MARKRKNLPKDLNKNWESTIFWNDKIYKIYGQNNPEVKFFLVVDNKIISESNNPKDFYKIIEK